MNLVDTKCTEGNLNKLEVLNVFILQIGFEFNFLQMYAS